jgi:hypothetical protein
MWRLLFLSTTSVLALPGCGDDCGPGGASPEGLVASSADVTLRYGGLLSGANNDCPDPAAPAGVVSLSLHGSQSGGTGLITLCMPRPDKLAGGSGSLGTDLRIIDLNGDDGTGCTYALNAGRPVLGTVRTSGMCDVGTHPAGYALIVEGNLSLDRDCPTMSDTIAVAFAGTIAVAAE